MSAREEILGRVRAALGPTAGAPEVPVPREYADASVGDHEDVLALFVERVEDYRAVVTTVNAAGLPRAVADALDGTGSVVVPDGVPQAWLSELSFLADTEVVRDTGLTAAELDGVGAVLTGAALGIAVTGTVVLDHAADQGRRALTLVPDVHVCVVGEDQLVADVGEGVARLAPAVAAGRPLTWISGPSATSDIELERVEGVHGPRTLHILVVVG